MPSRSRPVDLRKVETRIFRVRGEEVLLDDDLAALYGVSTKRLNEAVKRNRPRFPADFVFRLNAEEWHALRSQIATSNVGRGGRRYPPNAFTEHGAVMAATVLNSDRAVAMSLLIVRAFVRMRRAVVSHEELARKLTELERKYDRQFQVVFNAIREILDVSPPTPPSRRIGYLQHK